jgi:Flp pilus assembly protein TadG
MRHHRRDERGDAMVVFVVGLLLVILPLGGISVDLWHSISNERALQSAADAAAAAGAGGIDANAYRYQHRLALDPVLAAGRATASLAGQSGLPALSSPPEISVAAQHITVILREDVHLTLLRIVAGDRPIRIVATASSAPRPGQP